MSNHLYVPHYSLLADEARILTADAADPYPEYLYNEYVGADSVASFFAATIALNQQYAVVGSPGYSTFKGRVDIYRVVNMVTWAHLVSIEAPVATETLGSYQYGFGSAVSINGRTLVVSSELYGK
jgi:hypothetical protein